MKALLLPAVALALPQAAVLTRVTRSATLEVIGADFVRTARAKGLSEGETLRGHVVPNALIPVATILGLQLSFFFGGAILVENVFNLPGLGRLAYQALAQRDLVVIKDVVLIFSGLVILVNFAVDLGYLVLDPRLRSRRMTGVLRLRPNLALLVGGALTTVFVAIALVSLLWTPEAPTRVRVAMRLKAPLELGLLGTDHFGRDVVSLLMAGAWNSLVIAWPAVLLGAAVGIAIGCTAAALRGAVRRDRDASWRT